MYILTELAVHITYYLLIIKKSQIQQVVGLIMERKKIASQLKKEIMTREQVKSELAILHEQVCDVIYQIYFI